MIKFLHFEVFVVSYGIQCKIQNAINHFKISLLVSEMFRFKKLVNMQLGDWWHHLPNPIGHQIYNKAIAINLLQKPLKLSTLIVHTYRYNWIVFPWQLSFCQSSWSGFQHFIQFQPRKIIQGQVHIHYLTHSYAWKIQQIRHRWKNQNGMPKETRKTSNIGKVWNPACCHDDTIDNYIL